MRLDSTAGDPVQARGTAGAVMVGMLAIVMWSSLAALTAGLTDIPPFELMAVTFAIGGVAGLVVTVLRNRAAMLRQPSAVWILGTGGLFGDYALYFWSLRLAPAAQANLLSYLWPLLTVLFSTRLHKESLNKRHLAGLALGLLAVLVMTMTEWRDLSIGKRYWVGYLLAVGSAIVWAGYSTLARGFKHVSYDATSGFCLSAAALSLLTHVAFEPTVWPTSWDQWLLLGLIGFGPAGLAFAAWDVGIKHGDLRTLGILSYAIPVLSTLLLVSLRLAAPTVSLAVACALIASAGMIATVPSRSS